MLQKKKCREGEREKMDDVQNKQDSQLGGKEEEKKGKTAKAKEVVDPWQHGASL